MDYFELLGIQRDASPEQIKQAYREKAKLHHPDRHLDPKAKERHAKLFKQICCAYETLKDAHKKIAYSSKNPAGTAPKEKKRAESQVSYYLKSSNNIETEMPLSDQELELGCVRTVLIRKKFDCGYCNGKKCNHCNYTGVHLWHTQKVEVKVPPKSRRGHVIILRGKGPGDIPEEAGDIRITIT